jgi:hypothetical protein
MKTFLTKTRSLGIYLCIFLINCLNSPAQERNYAVSVIPAGLEKGADAVLRYYEEIFTVESQGKGTQKIRYAYTILNADGKGHANLTIGYSKLSSIRSLEGRLYDASGKQVDRIKKSDIKDGAAYEYSLYFTDHRYRSAQFEYGQYPFTVEFEYEMALDGLMYYTDFHPQIAPNIALEQASMKVIIPDNLKLRYKEINMLQKGVVSKADGKTVYYWTVKNFPVKRYEVWSTPWYEYSPWVLTAPTTFEIEGYTGDMSSWESFGKFISKLNAGRDVLPESTQAKVKNLVAKAKTPQEKVKILYEYMQSKTRYVNISLGIGGWQPMPAQLVDEKGYGDCKALSNYMKSLLATAGIEAHYTLVNAGEVYYRLSSDFPAGRFNHIILCVPLVKDTIWLECTSQTQPTGYLGNFTDDRHVLVVTPTGGKLIRTPRYTQQQNLQLRSGEVYLKPDGNATAKVTTQYTGLQVDYSEADRYAALSKEEQKKWINESLDIPQFNLLEFNLEFKKDRIPTAIQRVELSIPKFGAKSGKRIFITPNLMNKNSFTFPENEERHSDIDIRLPDYLDADTLRFHLPEGYHVEGSAQNVEYKSSFGVYKVNIKIEQGLITYLRTMSLKKGRYPKDKYKELTEFYQKINQADKLKVVLVSNT